MCGVWPCLRYIPACAGEAHAAIPERVRVRRARPRYIPACAGEAPTPTCGAGGRPVHPRVCGGSDRRSAPTLEGYIPACAAAAIEQEQALAGTSPRVRGKRSTYSPDRKPVHPRVCARRRGHTRTGVHPRVCGGSASQAPPRRPGKRVHPRVCGGSQRDARRWYIPACAPRGAAQGTSPRVRGKLSWPRVDVQHAFGGTSPRVRGKPDASCRPSASRTGTSPRVRGKHMPAFRFIPDNAPPSRSLRYIPACAGEAARGRLPWGGTRLSVHPRVCGGSESAPRGSPRVHRQPGYIPACAGEAG